MSTVVKDLGPVTAYADAVAAGYTGTKEEWQALMASYASVAEEAQEAKEGAEAAQEAAESARDAAIDAKEGAEDAVDGFGAVVTQATNQAVQTVRAEGTTQVGNVSSEGTTQVNAVQAKGAEVLESIPEDYTELSNDVSQLKEDLTTESKYQMLLCDEVPDTVQAYTFIGGSVSQVAHNRSNTAIRTDVFTYTDNTITEVRTLNTGESLTIVTNLMTLETTVTYAAA